MTLKEIYRIALARGMTAKQAGSEFNVKWDSIHKAGSKHKLPKLVSEIEFSNRKQIAAMNDNELKQYFLSLKNNQSTSKEFNYAQDEIQKRTT
jgi:hypothetical protein